MAFIRRTSKTEPNDIHTSKYWTQATYCGTTAVSALDTTSYQCTYWGITRSCEIAGGKVTWYSGQGETEAAADRGPIFDRAGFGNAIEWISDLKGWTWGTEPKVGAIMVYGSAWGSGYGHVRIVEAIDEANDRLYYSGGNEDNQGGIVFGSISPIPTGGGTSALNLMGYIYNPYVVEEDMDTSLSLYDDGSNVGAAFGKEADLGSAVEFAQGMNLKATNSSGTSVVKNAYDVVNQSGVIKSTNIFNAISLTQAEYDALTTKDENTLYCIHE